MENARYLECLAADFARLRSVAPIDQTAVVPSCPGWSVADLTRHVALVYVHKTIAMREGAEPEQWPPKELESEEPLPLLDRAYADLVAEFGSRKAEDSAGSWYKPDQSVGFWIRRMAQETVIHRIDAELGTSQSIAAIPSDLAVDGIDELLKVFLAYSVAEWSSAFNDILGSSPGRSCAVKTDGAGWLVRTAPASVTVEDGDAAADATISGPPDAVLRWLWNRESAVEPSRVKVEGAPEAIEELKRCLVIATQ